MKSIRYWKSLRDANRARRCDWCGWDYLRAYRCVCGKVDCDLQGMCHCGCGGVTEVGEVTQHNTEPPCVVSGLPKKYLSNHAKLEGVRKGRKNLSSLREILDRAEAHLCICGTVDCLYEGLCHCGCGAAPSLARSNKQDREATRTHIAGMPLLYVKGHSPQHRKGSDNSAFAGYRTQNSEGYWTLYIPEHPRAHFNGRVFEHIVLVEKQLGRPLLYYGHNLGDNEVVHHRNLDPSDNSLSNLRVMTARDHIVLHRSLTRRNTC